MILILTPDDLNAKIIEFGNKHGKTIYEKVNISDFNIGFPSCDWNETSDSEIILRNMDIIIFQYPNEHRGMETRVLYKRGE